MTLKSLLTTFLLLGSLSLSGQAASTERMYGDSFHHFNSAHEQSWLLLAEQTYISKAQAIDIAKHRAKGKILSADLIRKEQQSFYKIKVLTDQGRIKTLRINAQTKHR